MQENEQSFWITGQYDTAEFSLSELKIGAIVMLHRFHMGGEWPELTITTRPPDAQ